MMDNRETLYEKEAALQRELVALGRAYEQTTDEDEQAAILVKIEDTRNRMNAMRRVLGMEEVR